MSHHEIYVPHVGWFEHPPGDDVAVFLDQGWYEYREQAFLWLYLQSGDIVVDCGAHFGLFTILAATVLHNQATVFAIEPNAETVPLLRRNLETNGVTSVEVVEAAVSSSNGTASFYATHDKKVAYGGLNAGSKQALETQVRTVTLDSFLEQRALPHVAFLKLDVEGAEIAAIEGAARAITAGALPLLMVEFAELNLRRAGATTRDLFDALESRGYTVCRLDERSLELVPQACDRPVWYDNYFAARDPDAANARLRRCPPERKRIAQAVLVRGQSCRAQYDEAMIATQSLKSAHEEIRSLRTHLGNLLRSRYLRLGWKVGIIRKAKWIDEFMLQSGDGTDETR